jgi:hypothetical protein
MKYDENNRSSMITEYVLLRFEKVWSTATGKTGGNSCFRSENYCIITDKLRTTTDIITKF